MLIMRCVDAIHSQAYEREFRSMTTFSKEPFADLFLTFTVKYQ